MDFKKQKPIYLQIADSLCERIVAGEWQSEERMPSVRDVAGDLGVNPNTVLRTFDYLQSMEIIYNRRGLGYFIAFGAKEKVLQIQRKSFLEEELPCILQKMSILGISLQDLEKETAVSV